MANLSHTPSLQYAGLGQARVTGGSVTGNIAAPASIQVAASSTNLAVSLPLFVVANLKSIVIHSDAAVTLKTNSSGSPQDTITIAAGGFFYWASGSGISAQFAGNVTAWYATTGGTAANLEVLCLTS